VPSEGSLISATLSHTNAPYILLEVFIAFYIQQEKVFVMYLSLQEVSRVSRCIELPSTFL